MAKLRLSEWAHIAEMIGAIAVVISLLYVGVQVGNNTREIRAANRQQLVGRSHTATTGWAADPQLAAILARATEGDSLTLSETIQYGYVIRAVLYDVQEAYLLNQEGRLGDAYWGTRAALAKAYMTVLPPATSTKGTRH